MRKFPVWPAALLALALLPGAAAAWGPFTHVAIGRAVLTRIAAHPRSSLGFLRIEPYRGVFLASSMGPDMTFSVTRFGKTDKAYDKLFHDVGMDKRMIREALARGGSVELAFALGWYSHILADQVMCHRGSVIYRNVFELKPESLQRLGGDLPGMLKVAIDAILARQDPWILGTLPRCDVGALARALRAHRPSELPASDSELEARLTSFVESFAGSIATLREVSRTFGSNKRAFPDLSSELTDGPEGKMGPVPGIAESAKQIFDSLTPLVPARYIVTAGRGSVPEGQNPQGLWDRMTASVTRRSRGLLAGGGLASRMTRRVLDAALSGMNALGLAQERTLRARVMATFLGEMLSGQHDWEGVKAAIRAVADAPAKTGEEDGESVGEEDDGGMP